MLQNKLLKVLTPVALTACTLCFPAFSSQWGVFKGEIVTQWLRDGRRMLLRDDFSFIDSSGVTWLAPKGAIVDGASIPKPFWSIIGGPFEGQYRNASVIHDYYCESWKKHGRSWMSVHKAFYHAMLASGVPEAKAITMYIAVRQFGPRWIQPGEVIGGSVGAGWSGQSQQYYEPSMDVPSSEVEKIERIGIELAQLGTPPSTEVIDRRISSGISPSNINLPSQGSPPLIPPAR
jgi:hypothetical protein